MGLIVGITNQPGQATVSNLIATFKHVYIA